MKKKGRYRFMEEKLSTLVFVFGILFVVVPIGAFALICYFKIMSFIIQILGAAL